MKLRDVISYLESQAPLEFQESYDNTGLLVGSPDQLVSSALICVDATEEVIKEALQKKTDLIISHHPVIFSELKRLTGDSYIERVIIEAIRNNIALYSAHTNMDNIWDGVNKKIHEKLGLIHPRILSQMENVLGKLVFFVPPEYVKKVRDAVFNAGAGQIGEYDQCSFNTPGEGTFRGSDESDPFLGEKGKFSIEKEIRVETVYPRYLETEILKALKEAHPYEEVAYDLYPLSNRYGRAGKGMIGEFGDPLKESDFLKRLKEIFSIPVIRHTRLMKKTIRTVAVCGGSGSSLVKAAIDSGADAFVSSDFKYHQFFDAEGKILIADIGHYESEQFTSEIFHELLIKKFPKFAVHLSEINTNPIKYYCNGC